MKITWACILTTLRVANEPLRYEGSIISSNRVDRRIELQFVLGVLGLILSGYWAYHRQTAYLEEKLQDLSTLKAASSFDYYFDILTPGDVFDSQIILPREADSLYISLPEMVVNYGDKTFYEEITDLEFKLQITLRQAGTNVWQVVFPEEAPSDETPSTKYKALFFYKEIQQLKENAPGYDLNIKVLEPSNTERLSIARAYTNASIPSSLRGRPSIALYAPLFFMFFILLLYFRIISRRKSTHNTPLHSDAAARRC